MLPRERDSLPVCCLTAVRMVQLLGRAVTCPCGEVYLHNPGTAPEREALLPAPPDVEVVAPARVSTPGPAPDARVQVADEGRLRPSSTAPVARLTHTEDDELVRVRRLLCELRPDRGGPLGWAADGAPPAAGGSAWTPTLRVQTSVEVPAILPGAFASQARESTAPRLDPSSVLGWLQRHGTLSAGLRALYADCAKACASADARGRWEALAARAQHPAMVVHGRKLVISAMAEWWREDVLPEREISPLALASWEVECAAARAMAATGEALARVRGRVSVVVAAEMEGEGR